MWSQLRFCCGARRVVIPQVCGLAGLTSFETPGLGLAFTGAEETDRARRSGWVSGLAEALARDGWVRLGERLRVAGGAELWHRGAELAIGVGQRRSWTWAVGVRLATGVGPFSLGCAAWALGGFGSAKPDGGGRL
jgi:hypothetical protein